MTPSTWLLATPASSVSASTFYSAGSTPTHLHGLNLSSDQHGRFSIACRPPYLEKTLTSLASLGGLQHLAVYVSQDGNHTGVQQVVQRIGAAELAPPHTKSFTHWQRERIPQLGTKQVGLSASNAAARVSCAHLGAVLNGASVEPHRCCPWVASFHVVCWASVQHAAPSVPNVSHG